MSDTPDNSNDIPLATNAQTTPVAEPKPEQPPEVNPYPWLQPMPMMWLCVFICIALIVLGAVLNKG